jgi:uncharacterized membrane protein
VNGWPGPEEGLKGGLSAGEMVLFVAGAAITLVLLVGAVVFWVMLHRAEREAERADREDRREPTA